jgi:D-beta-D-heptose 7-phosphate kinase/D-beta-D-heptose 1-phosphate adenosyltransferase
LISIFRNLHEVIQEIEHNWATKRLLVVGDVMIDKYIWGEVGRISPEAPVPVVTATHQSQQPGGAANVAMNIARLGATAHVVGFTGGDEDELQLAKLLRSEGIRSEFIDCQGFPTITKQRIIAGRQQMLRLDNERLGNRVQADYDRLVASALALIPGTDAVILSDYAKGVLTPEVCQAIIEAARRLSIPVLVDPKSIDFSRYRGATTICPNLGELSLATHVPSRDLNDLYDAAEAMVPELDLEFLTATLSDKGIALIRPGYRLLAPAVSRQVFDVSGAGDTVIAVLALCLASGLSSETGVQLANVAAGVVVGKVGTVPVEKHELLAALSADIALNAQDKVVELPELVTRVALWKANGERVVYTSGCFDLLHVGHITLIEQARRFGDRLIVAINNDASVKSLKGPARPFATENDRARVLAALAAVDAVVVSGESNSLDVILAVRPDVLVKGGDHNFDAIAGATEMQSWGGQVKVVSIVEGYSTHGLTARSPGR